MSVGHADPLPLDVHEALVRLWVVAGLSPADVLRQAINLHVRELEDRQAVERRTYHASAGRGQHNRSSGCQFFGNRPIIHERGRTADRTGGLKHDGQGVIRLGR